MTPVPRHARKVLKRAGGRGAKAADHPLRASDRRLSPSAPPREYRDMLALVEQTCVRSPLGMMRGTRFPRFVGALAGVVGECTQE